jgi:hypothetical protein
MVFEYSDMLYASYEMKRFEQGEVVEIARTGHGVARDHAVYSFVISFPTRPFQYTSQFIELLRRGSH